MSFFYFLQRERNTNNHFVDRPVIFYEKTQTLSNLPSYKCNRKGPNSILRNLARQHAKRVDVALSKNLGSLKYFDSHKAKAFVVIKKNKQIVTATEIAKKCFWNQTFDKGRLKNFVLWFFLKYGEHKTVRLVEELKTIGFQYATKAGISLGVEDLKIPPKKAALIYEAEKLSLSTIRQFKRGEITEVERFQRLIDTWHRTSEQLKIEVIENFEGTDVLNPVYMMAFSGARGNISQVRQLVGMRGLMSNPQGQIIDFPIRSNFREGLTLTEYIISSYGARKGIVDTALRTANAGYLTRRLVDVAQHVIISTTDCGTTRGIFLNDMKEGNKTIYSLQNRLVGRVLARDVYNNQNIKIASKNMEISGDLAILIAQHHKKIFVRSPLTCQTNKLVCQLCYGWSLAQGNLVSIGEAVGIVAAQSIGEPGTQLTMRTFHTGGVFSGNVSDQIKAPFDGFVVYNNPIAGKLIRTPEGKIAFLTKDEGSFSVYRFSKTKRSGDRIDQGTVSTKAGGFDPRKATSVPNDLNLETLEKRNFKIPFYTLLFLRNREKVFNKQVIAQISSINRQKTATDQAELTIKAEISGLFYSKNLEIEETRSGPGIKENTTGGTTKKQSTANTSLVTGRRRVPKKALAPQSDQSAPHFASEAQRLQSIVPPDALQEQSEDHLLRELDIVDQSLVDIINKAWNWGYAWILSGKIYQLPFPSTFFPIFGDFVTKKTYMNCINWYLPSTFGSGFKINRPLTYSVFNQKTIKKMRQTLFSKEEFNLSPRTDKLIGTFNQSKNLNKAPTSLLEKDFKLLKYDLISFELSNILYKKIGYFLNLSQASHTSTMDARGFAAGDHLQDNQEIKTSLINVNQNYALPVVFPQSVLTSINPRPELRVEREVEVYHPRKAVISLDAKSPVLASSF
uniref:DNA-directed RNA polymerase n=1 Tax=Chlamydomonas moewusii TaxID=3054 RepID=B2X2C1_CHLMO|nr:RNA polymerase beta'' subunit [Chlamydomonas moewusii]